LIVFNTLHNLGINPNITVPLLTAEGVDPTNRPLFPEYVDPEMKAFFDASGLGSGRMFDTPNPE
jgi:hypothetical protein